MNNEVVIFKDNGIELNVNISTEENTVWLTANQMALLFDKDEKTIRKHINNVFRDKELDENNNTQKMRVVGVKQLVNFYTLDVIISVGYRVKSQRGIIFRQWANKILIQYLLQGYAVNEKRLQALNKTIQIQSEIIAGIAGIEAEEVLKVVNEYSKALELLDAYDHQCIIAPEGGECIYRLN